MASNIYDRLLQYIELVIIWSVIVCSSYPLNKTCSLNQNWFDKNQFMICKREAIIERFFMGKWTLDRHQKKITNYLVIFFLTFFFCNLRNKVNNLWLSQKLQITFAFIFIPDYTKKLLKINSISSGGIFLKNDAIFLL